MLQDPAPACQSGRVGVPHGAVRAWTATYVVRGLTWKPRDAWRRPQTLKLQPDLAMPAAQHVHRAVVLAQTHQRRRRTASHVGPAGPEWSYGIPRL